VKALKILATALLAYAGLVVLFESLLGALQPRPEDSVVIEARDDTGERHERVVSLLQSGGELYVAANHWPRAWYHRALEHPRVRVTRDAETTTWRAVPVRGEEHQRVVEDHPRSLLFQLMTGFPPRRLLRLEPR